MGKSRVGPRQGATPGRSAPRPPPATPAPAPRKRRWPTVTVVVALVLLATGLYFGLGRAPSTPLTASTPSHDSRTPPAFAGSDICAGCHAAEHAKWKSSQHALAMLPATAQSVRGDFAEARFSHAGVVSRFSIRDGRYLVRTDGPDGKLAEFEVKYTFGVAPLQQYLIELPRGRLQALGIAWDTRPKQSGGQRWFHLYPGRALKPGAPLHWTGIDQNWNYQCADCHSTNVRKHYDPATGTFKTTWSEISVGCESCHGPGADHLAWARKEGRWREWSASKGLTAALDERRGVSWAIDPATGNAARSAPRAGNREIESCARCHARRGQFTDEIIAGQPLHDGFRPALIEPGLYHADGQQRDEVYSYGSFLQSRMHASGVTCSDCHDPHTQTLRAAGNALCAQCHQPSKYDAPEHHHHRAASSGAQCTACHMPATTYMLVDPRHDHSMRIPRPDRSVTMGVPNPCSQCHRDRPPQWAADAVRNWFPAGKPGFQTFAEALHAGERGAPGAQGALLAVVDDRAQPAIARASALLRLARYLGPGTLPSVTGALNDADANVRMAAVQALSLADPDTRLRYLPRMLADPMRAVRMDAARALAGEPERQLPSADRAAFERALDEYVAAQRFNADRPEAQAALGTLHAARGQFEPAAAALRTALRLDPTFVQAAVNLADLHRARGVERDAEAVLREALVANAKSAPLLHALGLSLVRQKRTAEALGALAAAAKQAPEEPRFAYVYAVALHDSGKRGEAFKVLAAALQRHPYDRDLLIALGMYELEAGRLDGARSRARLLRALEPSDPEFARVAAQLEGTAR